MFTNSIGVSFSGATAQNVRFSTLGFRLDFKHRQKRVPPKKRPPHVQKGSDSLQNKYPQGRERHYLTQISSFFSRPSKKEYLPWKTRLSEQKNPNQQKTVFCRGYISSLLGPTSTQSSSMTMAGHPSCVSACGRTRCRRRVAIRDAPSIAKHQGNSIMFMDPSS